MFPPTLRRPAALLGVMLLGVFVAEPLIADCCDRDGPGAVWSFSTVATPSPDGAAPTDPSSVPNGPTPDHAVHVCHCAHGHFGGVPQDRALYSTPGTVVLAVAPLVQVLPNTMLPPPLRPPIA
jgi:hypothetical protein